jgi:hypothetical protein
MCGNYHLQRAEEILGFSSRNMEIWKTELEKWKHNWNQEAVKIEKALEILDKVQFQDEWVKQLRMCLSQEETVKQK